MSDIRSPLEELCTRVKGAYAATIMGHDGLPVDTVGAAADNDLDVAALVVEFGALVSQVQRSAQMFAAGDLEELAIRSERLTTILRPINESYFLVLALRPGANLGMGRYLVRMSAPKLADALA